MKINKSYFKSKTLWVALITALAPLFPEVEAIVQAYPSQVAGAVGLAFAILRSVTNKPLAVKEVKGISID